MVNYTFENHPDFLKLFNKNCKVKDVKRILDEKTRIKATNIRFQIFLDFNAL